ncbi:MAG: GNAT family N-acetyltransferase [Ilumatobacteraceae bacterium]
MTVVRRLDAADTALARATFRLIAEVFEDEYGGHDDRQLGTLLADERFWAFAVLEGDEVIGGLTAHVLPMTRNSSSELFVYDLAVHPAHQRRGVGRRLMEATIAAAAAMGIEVVFVAADDDDEHALDFYRALGGRPGPATFFDFGAD